MQMQMSDEASFVSGNSNVIFEMWSLSQRSVFSTTMLLIMTVAIVGNILVITVILQNRGMRTRTNMFLCSLAISDLLCALCDMPFSLVTVITGRWLFHEYSFLCQLNGFLMPLFFINSTHTLMYIAIHKYISIRYPFSVVLTERLILLMIMAAWIWAAIVSTLTVTGLSTVQHKLYTTQCGATIPKEAKAFSHLALVLVTCYLVPLTVIVVCYSSLFRHIREHGDRLEMTTTTERSVIDAQQRRILFTLILVVVAFVVSWTPWGIYSIYLTIIQDEEAAVRLANPITYWFGYLNSACSPIIYALRSEAFRDGYRDALCRSKWKRFSVGTRMSYNISDHFQHSVNNGNSWKLNTPLSINSKVNDDEKRFSTCSLPVNTITILKPRLDTVFSVSEHLEKGLNDCDRQDMILDHVKPMTGDGKQVPRADEGHFKTRASKSCGFQSTYMYVDESKLTSGAGCPESSPRATEVVEEDLISGICFRPRFRTMDWNITERSGRGIDPGRRMTGAKETKRITGSSVVPGKAESNPCTEESGVIRIHRDTFCQEHDPVGISVESSMKLALSVGLQQTLEIDAMTNPKNWRKRLSTKWKRHSQKTSSHRNQNCSTGSSSRSPSSNPVRRSVTTRQIPGRCPSVERLDHLAPRQRTMTEVPAAYRRRRTGADCLVLPSNGSRLDRPVHNRCTNGVRNESENFERTKRQEEKKNEEGNWEEKEYEENELGKRDREDSKESSNALDCSIAVPNDRVFLSNSGSDLHLSRPVRFLSDSCDHVLIRKDSTQGTGTLNATNSPSKSKRGRNGYSNCSM